MKTQSEDHECEFVIVCQGAASGDPNGDLVRGQYLESYDPEAFDGRGDAGFSGDPDKAMRFASCSDALILWRTISKTRPSRPDGRPNRPLTYFDVSIEPLRRSQ